MSAHQGPALPWSFVRFLSFWCDFWRYRVYIWSLSLDIYMLFVLVCLHFCVCKPMRECASPTLLPLIIHSRFQPPSHWNKTQSSSKSHSRTNVSQTATYCKCHPPPPTQYSKASVPTICRMLIRALCHLIPLAGTSGIRATLATVSYILNPLEPVGLLNTAFVYPSVCVCVSICWYVGPWDAWLSTTLILPWLRRPVEHFWSKKECENRCILTLVYPAILKVISVWSFSIIAFSLKSE